MKKMLRILVVEDSEDDALLVLHQIKKGGYDIDYERVQTSEEMKTLLIEKTWDIILSDYMMPHFNGLEALTILKESGIDIPFIIISGTIGEDVAVEAMKAGAHDYLMKNNLQRLLPAVERELRESASRAERKRAEFQLIESEQKFRSLAESFPDNIIRYDTDCRAVYINRNMSLTEGSDVVSIIGHTPMESNNFPTTVDYQAILQQVIQTGQPGQFEVVVPDLNGELRVHHILFVAERNNDSKIIGALAIGRDITERKQAEMEIARMNRVLRMLSETNQALIRITDEETLLNEVCQIVVKEGGYQMVWVGFAEHDEAKTLRPVSYAGFESGYIESAKISWGDNERGHGPGGTAIRTGQPCIERNIPFDSSFAPWREAAIQRGYKSIIVLPLISEGLTFGAIGIYSSETDSFDIKEVEILKELSDDLAFGIVTLRNREKKTKAEEMLRESEERYRLIAENTADTIAVLDLNLHFTYISPSILKLRGFSVEEAMTQSLDQAFIPDSLQKIIAAFSYQMALEADVNADPYRTETLELEEFCKDGSIIFIETAMSFIRDSNFNPTGILTVTRDITERKRADELQKAIYHISEAAQTTAKLDELYGSIHAIIAELMPVRNFYIALYNKTTDTIHFPYFVDEFDTTPSTRKPGRGLTGYVLRTGNPLLTTPQLFEQLEQSGQIESMGKQPVDWLGVPLKTQHGETIGVMAVQTYSENIRLNITHQNILEFVSAQVAMVIERKKYENELRKLSEAVEQSPASIVITDINGDIEYVNKRFEDITGYTTQEAYHKNPRILQSGHTTKEEYKVLWDTILSGKTWHGEFLNKKKKGDLYWEDAFISPIKDEDGITIYYLAVKQDITEKKKIEAELIEAKEHAEESDRLKTAFLNNISHEIRTPFNGILGFLSIIQGGDLTVSERDNYIGIINKSAYRLMNTINDIVEISKIQAGQVTLKLSETNIKKLAGELFTRFKTDAEVQGLEFTINNELHQKIESIYTDGFKLNTILSNLIGNALKFTKAGSIQISIHLNGDDLVFSVKDTGMGLRPEKQELIFHWFRQGSESLTRSFEGAGLGLSISKAYVEMLGGKIWVESEIEKGSTFYFTIPYKPALLLEEIKESKTIAKIKTEIKNNYTVLVVEDEEVNYLYIEMLLEIKAPDIRILHAKNGQEAVEICKNNRQINLVLMDIKMPVMNGYEATKQIKEFRPDLPIIAQTAYSTTDDKDKAKSAGCDDFISKPISGETLNQIIAQYIPNRRG